MSKRVYGIYPTMAETRAAVDSLIARGAPASSILVLSNDLTGSDLNVTGVQVDTLESDHKTLWERFKHFFGVDDYDDFENTVYAEYSDDIDAGKSLIFVEEKYLPQLADEVISCDNARLSVNMPDNAEDEDIIRLLEEQLRVSKEAIQTGEVRLRKTVSEREETFTVPVLREELVIEKVTPTRTSALPDDFEEETITIPLMEEQVNVSKVPVVTAEYHIRKKSVEDYREVSDTVRSEELEEVDEKGNIVTVKK